MHGLIISPFLILVLREFDTISGASLFQKHLNATSEFSLRRPHGHAAAPLHSKFYWPIQHVNTTPSKVPGAFHPSTGLLGCRRPNEHALASVPRCFDPVAVVGNLMQRLKGRAHMSHGHAHMVLVTGGLILPAAGRQ